MSSHSISKTLVLGASENPHRYSNLAIKRLRALGHPVVAIGRKAGKVEDVLIETGMPALNDIDTITVYLNPLHQQAYYDYIMGLHPRRIIFNPGAENDTLYELALEKGITPVEACTLVMLSAGQY